MPQHQAGGRVVRKRPRGDLLEARRRLRARDITIPGSRVAPEDRPLPWGRRQRAPGGAVGGRASRPRAQWPVTVPGEIRR